MKVLSCFVIMPFVSENDAPIKLIADDKRGLAERPTGWPEPGGEPLLLLDFNFVYNKIIKLSIEQFNKKTKKVRIDCNRGQDLKKAGAINAQVVKEICRADITITDISTWNPNVFLEHGIRLAVKDSLNMMICHKDVTLPFDVRTERCIFYSRDVEVADKAREEIVGFLDAFVNPADDEIDLIVNEFKRNVDIYTNRILNSRLLEAYRAAPKLATEFASYLLSGEKAPELEDDVLEFLLSVGEVLEKNDPNGQLEAVKHYELISRISGLDSVRLKSIYYKLKKICDADPMLKDKGDHYFKKYLELQEKANV